MIVNFEATVCNN